MAKKSDGLSTGAIAAGAAVAIGIVYFATKSKSKCSRLPGIWKEEGPLHLTEDALSDADDYVRRRMREYIISGAGINRADLQLEVAHHLEDCKHWGNQEKMSDKQKQVWEALGDLISRIKSEADFDTERFLSSID